MELTFTKRRFILSLAETRSIFFMDGLRLKDGRPTPYFVNLGRYSSGKYSYELGSYFSELIVKKGLDKHVDIIVGPSYKGSAIAQAISICLFKEFGIDLPFDYDRKEIKVHGEATKLGSLFVNNHFFDGCRVLIVDDVLTSMATKYELLDKIKTLCQEKSMAVKVVALLIAVDREQVTAVYDKDGSVMLGVKGSDPIVDFKNNTGIEVYSIVGIREVVEYLYQEKIPVLVNDTIRPLDDSVKKTFDSYMEMYGVTRKCL